MWLVVNGPIESFALVAGSKVLAPQLIYWFCWKKSFMATAETRALEELRGLQDLLRAQDNLVSQDSIGQQVQAWVLRLEGLHLMPGIARDFVDMIRAGPWTDVQQQRLIASINTAVLNASSRQAGHVRRELQECLDFRKYFSQQDLDVLQDRQVSLQSKLNQIVTRLGKLDLHLPSEPTSRRILALAMKHGLEAPAGGNDGLYSLHNEFKRMLKAHVKNIPRPTEHLVKYPTDPGELPPNLLQRAYAADDQPMASTTDLVEIVTSSNRIPLRRCNRMMQSNQQTVAMVPRGNSGNGGNSGLAGEGFEQMQMGPMGMMMNMMFRTMMSACGQNLGEEPSLQMMRPPTGRKQKALEDKASHGAATEAASTQLALSDRTPQAEASSSTVAPGAEVTTPSPKTVTPSPKTTPSQKALTTPSVTPESQIAAFEEATKQRTLTRKALQGDLEAAAEEDDDQPAETSKAKAKAKAKTQSKSAAKPDGKKKPDSKAKAKADVKKKKAENTPETTVDEKKAKSDPSEKEKGQPSPAKKAKATPKAERVVYDMDNKPPLMVKGSPTVWYLGGKVHCNGNDYRVFLKSTDRNDRKVKIGDDPQASWEKCLKMIEDARDVD